MNPPGYQQTGRTAAQPKCDLGLSLLVYLNEGECPTGALAGIDLVCKHLIYGHHFLSEGRSTHSSTHTLDVC
jgi:hypothetical protein